MHVRRTDGHMCWLLVLLLVLLVLLLLPDEQLRVKLDA